MPVKPPVNTFIIGDNKPEPEYNISIDQLIGTGAMGLSGLPKGKLVTIASHSAKGNSMFPHLYPFLDYSELKEEPLTPILSQHFKRVNNQYAATPLYKTAKNQTKEDFINAAIQRNYLGRERTIWNAAEELFKQEYQCTWVDFE